MQFFLSVPPNKWLTLCANSNRAEAIFLTVISNIYLVTVNRQVGQVGEPRHEKMPRKKRGLRERERERGGEKLQSMAAISQLSFFLLRRSSASRLENSQGAGKAVRKNALVRFYVSWHIFPLAKLNDWLSVPFRMVSGSEKLPFPIPFEANQQTSNLQYATHAT